MERILMAGLPAHGLVQPSFPLVRALVDAGHTVDYLVPAAFHRRVEALGATPIGFAPYLDGALTSPKQLARHGRRMFADLHRGLLARGNRYDAVVSCGLNPRVPELERRLDVPVIVQQPVFFFSDRVARHFADIAVGLPAPVRHLLRTPRLRRTLGAAAGRAVFHAPVRDILDLLAAPSRTLNLTVSSRYYQPLAEDFDDPRCFFMGPTPTLPVPDPDFPLGRLDAHDGPVVYGTLGTVFNTWTPFFRTLADAFAGTDALLVLTTGNRANLDRLGPVPPNVIARDFVPQTEILARADLCFTHAGFGSATDAVLAGVPPVLTPRGADQFFNAYRLAELDAGSVLTSAEFTAGAVRRAAGRLLAETPAGLAPLRASFATAPGPAGAVTAIERVL